jgi:hypothetical protein
MTKADVVQRVRQIEPALRALGVTRLSLFGSFARGNHGPESDVDLIVDFAPGSKTFDHFNAVFDLLEERLERRVELVTRQSLSPYIGPHVLTTAEDVIWAA